MKIICKNGYNVKQTLQLVAEYIEKQNMNYPLLEEDMVIEICLKGRDGESCPNNGKTICFGKKELDLIQDTNGVSEDYYNKDSLTGLYNRGKYEHDIDVFQVMDYKCLICVYIDAVGLHEINNHLGHKAGDHMLCCIADGIREHFPAGLAYRIGGDEFVVLCLDYKWDDVTEKLSALKQKIREMEYEISAGMAESTDSKTLNDTINYAENTMRRDKMNFYRNNGGLRQMRSLNHKLEKLLLEKQDASHFLEVIAPRYKGVYMVNSKKDRCRYIYIPPYFHEMLEKNQGSFLLAMRDYYHTLVRCEYYERFEEILDYKYVQECLSSGNVVNFTYQKLDGNWVELQITVYDQDLTDKNEMLWIFLDDQDNA